MPSLARVRSAARRSRAIPAVTTTGAARPTTRQRRSGTTARCGAASGPRPRPWLQDHHRGLPGAAGGIGVEVPVDLAPALPQPLPLLAPGGAAADQAGPVDEVGPDVGLGLQVQPPGRLAVTPAVHGQGDEVRAVLEVADDHRVLAARPAPAGGEPQGAPLAGLRQPQAQTAVAQAVEPPVGDPEEPDEPAGRKSWLPGRRAGRHGNVTANCGSCGPVSIRNGGYSRVMNAA